MAGRNELARNATQWAQTAKRELAKAGEHDVGFIFIFFPKGAAGEARGVFASNVHDSAWIAELQAVLRKKDAMPRIAVPGGD